MLASRWFRKGEELEGTGEGRGFLAAFDRGYRNLDSHYRGTLRWCLARPWLVTIIGNVILVIAVIFLFLRNASATIIPSLALPASIVGTFASAAIRLGAVTASARTLPAFNCPTTGGGSAMVNVTCPEITAPTDSPLLL